MEAEVQHKTRSKNDTTWSANKSKLNVKSMDIENAASQLSPTTPFRSDKDQRKLPTRWSPNIEGQRCRRRQSQTPTQRKTWLAPLSFLVEKTGRGDWSPPTGHLFLILSSHAKVMLMKEMGRIGDKLTDFAFSDIWFCGVLDFSNW